MLDQVKAKAEKLNLPCTDLVLDHAIYSKALEVINDTKNDQLRDFINLRMGGFHACGIFLAVIGKRFGSAGIRDLIIEAGIAGSDSTERILKGKHYNRGVRFAKYVYEAIQRAKFEAFQTWLQEEGKRDLLVKLVESGAFQNLLQERRQTDVATAMDLTDEVCVALEEFDVKIRNGELGPMAEFWQSFIDMVQVLLDFIKATRNGDWDLHLQTTERMLVWMHAYDRTNYSRHFTYYWASQQKLHTRFPSIYQEFQMGNFSTRRTPGKFNMLPPDQVIEQTINRDQKGTGGIKAVSTSTGSVQRWVLSSHNTATIAADLRQSIGLDGSNSVPKDLGKKRMKFDEESVRKCHEVIGNNIYN